MNLNSAYNLIGGAILGAIAGVLLPWAATRYRRWTDNRVGSKRREILNDNNRLYSWLVHYYEKRNALPDLYSCKIGNYEIRIPFLSKPEWQPSTPLTGQARAGFLEFSNTDSNFPVDKRLLKQRERMGQRLFNAPTAYVDRVEIRDGMPRIHLMPCRYFEVATSMIKLEEETFKVAAGRPFAKTPMRDQYLSSATAAGEILYRPRSLGCAFVLAVKASQSYEILIHTRSHETVTFGGAKAVTPNFGFEPLSYAIDSSGQGMPDLLIQNFVKEYLEELFNYEDLISVVASRRADPLWFLELPEAQEMLTWIADSRFEIEVLGLGFDALNGNAVMAAMGVLDDEVAAASLRKRLALNWEIGEGTSGVPDGAFVDFRSGDLERWLRQNRYHTGAAFALSKAVPSLHRRTGAKPTDSKPRRTSTGARRGR